jgi:hypothetical protein
VPIRRNTNTKAMKLSKITPYQRQKITRNLLSAYETRTPKDTKEGREWYTKAHNICAGIGKELGYDLVAVAHVLSALSPRNKWERNITDAYNVLKAVNEGKGPESVKVCTFTTNKVKAFEIAKGNIAIDKASPKTFAFVNNIAHLDATKITIDVWHLRAAFGGTIDSGLTPLRYRQIEDITLRCAKKVGVKGYEFQAIVWGIVRNKKLNSTN